MCVTERENIGLIHLSSSHMDTSCNCSRKHKRRVQLDLSSETQTVTFSIYSPGSLVDHMQLSLLRKSLKHVVYSLDSPLRANLEVPLCYIQHKLVAEAVTFN